MRPGPGETGRQLKCPEQKSAKNLRRSDRLSHRFPRLV